MTIIFPNQAELDKIAQTPSGVNIGIPLESVDGRRAVVHPFSATDLAFFNAIPGVVVREALPGDWQYPEEPI